MTVEGSQAFALTDDEVALLRARGRRRRYPRGASLLQEGDRADTVAYLRSARRCGPRSRNVRDLSALRERAR